MPWDAIKYVGSGLTLAAFVVAAIAWLLKSKSEERERLIKLADDEERAGLVRAALEFFSVDTAGLTRDQQYQLALEQIRARAHRFKVVAVIVCLVAVLGAVVAVYAISRPDTRPIVQKQLSLEAGIWKVEADTKGSLVATKEFPVSPTNGPLELVEWVSGQLQLAARQEVPKVRLKVQIPADLESQEPVFQRIPEGPLEALLWDERGSTKGRRKATREALKRMQGPYKLEIRVPGSRAELIEVTAGAAFNREMDLPPAPVSIGVEKFDGLDEGVSAKVCAQLGAHPMIRVVNPGMLETVRKEIEHQREMIRNDPHTQMAIRELGVDYLISGSVQAGSR